MGEDRNPVGLRQDVCEGILHGPSATGTDALLSADIDCGRRGAEPPYLVHSLCMSARAGGRWKMQVIVLLAVQGLCFAVLDAVMLTRVMQPLFRQHIGPLMLDGLRIGPAVGFYALYIAGLTLLVSLPALRAGSLLQAAMGGAILGAVAYGTYELTSHTIMKDWDIRMVVTDMAWGTFLSALTATVGVVAARAVGPG
jgi:uncharacterized membrane protein